MVFFAPQVGINRNLFWVQRFDKPGEPFEFYINPKIIWRSELLRKGMEGCLSIPEDRGDVYRNYTIKVTYFDLKGNFKEEIVEGFTAVIFQHEEDHLNGILFTDRIIEQAGWNVQSINNDANLFLRKN
ncbi:peptide deformylase [Flavobacterium piscinae]|uniref:peptide deformylase n=1 Tax=Flavobacterium piscinae TaxID=2506424 RepID=UPI0019BC8340|nr:peptide deformylase [Flavobacterium piscinae]MBC8882444.1 peptide deformylase [Flavobacterium piscinae]